MISSNVVLTADRLEQEVEYFLTQPKFVFDVETVGTHRGVPQVNQVTWLSMATHARTIVIPMGHPNGDVVVEKARRRKDPDTNKFVMYPAVWDDAPKQLWPADAFEILKPLFMNESIAKGAHNATFDLLSVAKYYGEVPPGPYHDTIVMAWLLNENRRLGLKDLTIAHYGRKYDHENVGRRVEIHPFTKVAQYAYMDAKYTWLHLEYLSEFIKANGLSSVYQLERDTLGVLLDMGAEGTPVDEDGMRKLESELSERVVEIEGRIYKAAGKRFNLNSNPQKIEILYGPKIQGNQGLKPWRLTKGGIKKQKEGKELLISDYSTDSEALEKYKGNPVVDALTEYQEVNRVLGTYVQGYLGVEGDPKKPGQIFEGKVYPDFVQYGTVTGRFSCRAPNLQNLPRPDSVLGKAVRGLIVAGEGFKLAVADYGQIEMVVLAHFAGHGALWDGFLNGIDPHTQTAALVFGVAPEDVTKDMRQAAKAINFAVVYGAGPDKVASMANTTTTKAKKFLDTHERAFPEIYNFKEKALSICKSRKPPHLVTLMGRKRRIPAIWSTDFKVRGKAERQAINSLIQGSSADLIKLAMIRANDALSQEDTGRLILSVHDELVIRATESNAEKAAAIVREAMLGPGIQKWVDVPLSIDLKVVDRWSEAK